MGQYRVLADFVAVASDRLVAIVRVEDDGKVLIRDLAKGGLQVVSASELSAPPSAWKATPAALSAITCASDAQRDLARRIEGVTAVIADATDVSNRVKDAAARLGLSRRTVFCFLARYRESPQTSSLLPRPRGTASLVFCPVNLWH